MHIRHSLTSTADYNCGKRFSLEVRNLPLRPYYYGSSIGYVSEAPKMYDVGVLYILHPIFGIRSPQTSPKWGAVHTKHTVYIVGATELFITVANLAP